jgi:hypothetical protein
LTPDTLTTAVPFAEPAVSISPCVLSGLLAEVEATVSAADTPTAERTLAPPI